jgi:excinuclease UvrABC nuclease subunit
MEERIRILEQEMRAAAKEHRFEKAAELRDRIKDIKTVRPLG